MSRTLVVTSLLLLVAGLAHAQEQPMSPLIGVEPSSYDFGVIGVGTCEPVQVRVFNDGDPGTTLEVTGLSVEGSVELPYPPSLPFQVAFGSQFVAFTVRGCPGASGPQQGVLTVESSNALNSPFQVPFEMFGDELPVCDHGGPYEGSIGEAIQFDGSESYDPDGTIVSYQWDFGDGSRGSGPTPSHIYGGAAVYVVTLTLTDDLGESSDCGTTASIEMGPVPPICDTGGPYAGHVGLPVVMDGRGSYDPDGHIVSYEWDFGDGGTATGPVVQHSYQTIDVFVVGLLVTDNSGLQSSCTDDVTITPIPPPTCDAGGPYQGIEGVAVYFDGTGSSSAGTITSYDWDFGDGHTASGPHPFHTYAVPDAYQVELCVSDDLGGQSCCGTEALIYAAPPPNCDAGGPYEGIEGEPVQFDGTASSAPFGIIVSYEWEFGDGDSGSGPLPTHTYAAPDQYEVTLCVVDDGGRESCCATGASITPFGLPVCDAGGPYASLPAQSIQFDGSGSYDPNGTIVTYAWEFGDGHTAQGPMPAHTYASTGTYDVTLCVTDNEANLVCCDTPAYIGHAGSNEYTTLPMHAIVTSFGPCEIPDPCPDPTVEVAPGDAIAAYLLLRHHDNVAGVQTAFDWGTNVFLFGLWDCQANQVNGVVPEAPGGPTTGTIATAFDCVVGGETTVIGRMHFEPVEGCIYQVGSAFPFGTHVVDCQGSVMPIIQECWGLICVGFAGHNACDECGAGVPLEPTTWGQIKARYR